VHSLPITKVSWVCCRAPCGLVVDIKFRIYIPIHIHRFYVDIHGYINRCLYLLYTCILESCMGTRTLLQPSLLFLSSSPLHAHRVGPSPPRSHRLCPHSHPTPLFRSAFSSPFPWHSFFLTQHANRQLALFSSGRMFT